MYSFSLPSQTIFNRRFFIQLFYSFAAHCLSILQGPKHRYSTMSMPCSSSGPLSAATARSTSSSATRTAAPRAVLR